MKIDYCILCYKFQRRLSWCLSSIAQQKGKIPELTINIAYVKNDGEPTTEKVINTFRDKLTIKEKVYDSVDKILDRGLVRNDLIGLSDSEWIFMADCDHVYPTSFFSELYFYLENFSYLKNSLFYSFNRKTTDTLLTDKAVSEHGIYVDNAHDKADKIQKIDVLKSKKAGGSMQVVRRNELNGIYTIRKNNIADKFIFRSDINFRRRFKSIVPVDLPDMIHLNHDRERSKDKINQN